ncbi:MAG: hypothetical protein KJ970_03295 [Candidatus Eisenbacteria bacterium]|uniref:Uncharacterized protein n=1 Tax=Eiseniibacteriota bacterium TaxID=2212470 RepID=A0A948RTY5_UNCEI|nr:hypothetical protein [Candidatus Eisenbacteria bacterium]MBU1948460.1 hypothetical protein [Candidatus Eisenbacteria bacterium]MBU2689926.1 hypothetical protein [Candidatus Eisenbacteria bacterium]
MRVVPISSILRILIIVIGFFLCSGCKGKFFNKTYINDRAGNSNLSRICITLRAEGADNVWPEMDSNDGWYGGNEPVVTLLGNDEFSLAWNVNIPSSGSIHIGGAFAHKHTVAPLRLHVEWEDGWSLDAGIENLEVQNIGPGDYEMWVGNYIDCPDCIEIEELQWAVSLMPLGLENLVWDDPILESLPWENIIDGNSIVLCPGDKVDFDIPDELIVGYARWS